jgi:hypothetical protein
MTTSSLNQKLLPMNLSPDTGYGAPTNDLSWEKDPIKDSSAVSKICMEEIEFSPCELINGSEEGLITTLQECVFDEEVNDKEQSASFSFDYQPDLTNHAGPSPNVLLQALTMSNANDGINLERLETIGDSFLKYAITNYLYSTHDNVHEGKLSHIRSKQVGRCDLRAAVFSETIVFKLCGAIFR